MTPRPGIPATVGCRPSPSATATTEPSGRPTRRERLAGTLQRGGAFVVLAIVTILASLVFGTRFASVDNFLNILEASSFLGLVAVGMTFVIIGGGIDLSVGIAPRAVGGPRGLRLAVRASVAAIALPLGVCGVIGLVNGVLVARARMAAFIVTLATLLFARGLAFAVSDEGNTIFHIDADLAVPLARAGVDRTGSGCRSSSRRSCSPSAGSS